MEGLIIGLILVVSVLLVLLVLAQDSKGGGLTAGMGGASQIMGARRTTDWIEKATWVMAIALFVFTLSASALITDPKKGDGYKSSAVENATAPITTGDEDGTDIGTTEGGDTGSSDGGSDNTTEEK